MLTQLDFLKGAKRLEPEIIKLRRHLHAHPELSFEERETAKLAANKLADLGYKVQPGVGKTGVVADIGTGITVAIRADMDGLPIQEQNGTAYNSKNPGVSHACGHDAHVSCALAAAEILAAEKLPGKIRMLMQPAEENGDADGISGARRMIEDGAMQDVSAVIGLHMDATIPAGKVAIMPGAVMAAADIFKVTVQGKGGHGAYPETTIDAVILATQVIQAIQQIISRKISALDPAVITVGSVQSSSTRGNVISEEVVLLGSIRSFNQPTRQKIMDELDKACSVARVLGGDYRIEYEIGYPATINHPDITSVMKQSAIDLLGPENVIVVPPKTWSEDFSMLAEEAPGAFMFLGGEIQGSPRCHHSPTFDLDESGLYIGSAVLAETARRLLTTLEKK